MVAFIVNLVCITIIEVIIEELGTRWEMEKKSGKKESGWSKKYKYYWNRRTKGYRLPLLLESLTFHIVVPVVRTDVKSRDYLACSKRSDSGERCEVKKAMKSRGGLGTEVLAFIFSRSFLRRTAPHYLNAWNRLQRFGLLSSSFQERPGLELILFAYSRRIISFF